MATSSENHTPIPPPPTRAERVQIRTMATDIASLKRTGGSEALGNEESAPSIPREEGGASL